MIGVVGARAVTDDLANHGHRIVELERGSTDTKLWKDVKRKRVRIPDLLCLNCGLRIECRAKTKAELSMSHSLTDAERAWDYGMVNQDLIGLPVCGALDEAYWSVGDLRAHSSYWHERNWVRWTSKRHINYFRVEAFRSAPFKEKGTKGVTEGSETSITWKGTFSTRTGVVDRVEGNKVTIRRRSDGHRYTWTVAEGMQSFVEAGEAVEDNQLIAGVVAPVSRAQLACSGALPPGYISTLLRSRERTLRFTGVKLARLLSDDSFRAQVEELAHDGDEDIYIRLEGCAYLSSACSVPASDLFTEHLQSRDPQTQLESVIALGETATKNAIELLSEILDDAERPYFLRSAAAWSLAQSGDGQAIRQLVGAFADVDLDIRNEALEGLVSLGGPAVAVVLEELSSDNDDLAAGSAEVLRQIQPLPREIVQSLVAESRVAEPSKWTVWLLGNLPREHMAPLIADLQESAPKIHYAVTLLWSFVESWIARRWELRPRATSNRN